MSDDTSHHCDLSDDVIPIAYEVSLEPDFSRLTYQGQVVIDVDVREATNVVKLHAKDLIIIDANFQLGDGTSSYHPSRISCISNDMLLHLTFADILPVKQGKLTVNFQGRINDQMKGFYCTKYRNADGEEHLLARTHFEPIDVRSCFPCWDEPGRKANFTIILTVPSCMMAMSCMPESRSETLACGKKRVSFMPTPKTRTHTIAFCIGEFEYIQEKIPEGPMVRTLCCVGKASQLDSALRVTVGAIEFYNSVFGIPYPVPKMDVVAIPDFPRGVDVMENWGLVSVREVYFEGLSQDGFFAHLEDNSVAPQDVLSVNPGDEAMTLHYWQSFYGSFTPPPARL